jgi:GNAT superfamily N-acetyltransferase
MNLPFDWTIRDATPGDAPEIAALIRGCWPHDTPDSERIARLIGNGHRTLCAQDRDQCIGFVDCFTTRSASGVFRWETDLLAVSAAVRGRGIGKALVSAAVQAAPALAALARGLIRVGNAASERAFAAAGFQTMDEPLVLFGAPPLAGMSPRDDAAVVHVETLTYSGLWLERPVTVSALHAGQAMAAQLGAERVGALVPYGSEEPFDASGFERVGIFRWWVRTL